MENKNDKVEEQNILDMLLDEDNEDPIVLYDEKDNKYTFDQIAVIPLDDKLYAILKPIGEMEGVADDEAIPFLVDDSDEENATLNLVEDEDIAVRVFDEYYKLLDKNQ